jgi:hypothetical protein
MPLSVALCATTMSITLTKGSSKVVLARCGRIRTTQMEGSLEVADSLPGSSSKATHQAGACIVRTLVQPPREKPVKIAEVHQWWDHTNVDTTS